MRPGDADITVRLDTLQRMTLGKCEEIPLLTGICGW
jgi:hypothetical protein